MTSSAKILSFSQHRGANGKQEWSLQTGSDLRFVKMAAAYKPANDAEVVRVSLYA